MHVTPLPWIASGTNALGRETTIVSTHLEATRGKTRPILRSGSSLWMLQQLGVTSDTRSHGLRTRSSRKTFYFGRLYNHTCPDSTTSTTVVLMASVLNDTITGTSAVQCSPTYFQHLVSVTVPPPPSQALETLVVPGTTQEFIVDGWQGMLLGINSTIQTYSDNAINAGVNFNLQTDLFLGWGTATLDWQTCDCDPWFSVAGHGQTVNATDLMNPDVLANATAGLFTEVWSDLADRLLFTSGPSPTMLTGRIQGSRSQLVSRAKSIRVAQAALIFLVIALVVGYSIRPRADLPLNPSSLIAHAFLLRASHDKISETMKDTPIMSGDQTRVALRDWNFRIENQEHFFITPERQTEASLPELKGLEMERAWRPPILHPMFKLSLALIVIGTILSLEFALRHSTSHQGFGSLAGEDWWTYIASGYLFFLCGVKRNIRTIDYSSPRKRNNTMIGGVPAMSACRFSRKIYVLWVPTSC
ncbi:hypothetical protein B0H16DRAFT_1483314 [Mycena metata]|uniref:Uncharacterized protein n=1 Tax=Mycena metata TaxID=1033252 RepID=A0AAD7DYK1_9AGAR|nr:hypothetical protein B0H16DRAFT_1483314 [Mycena metata]